MKKYLVSISAFILLILFLSGCAASRYTRKTSYVNSTTNNFIRVLLKNENENISFVVRSPVYLYAENNPIAVINTGNRLDFYKDGNNVKLNIRDRIFDGKFFQLKPEKDGNTVEFNGRKYDGVIKIVSNGNSINIVNQVSLEDYLKGVITAEMPIGKGSEYLEALKAFAICARTYAVTKLNNGNSFDVYLDTRDQVYNGAGRESAISNRAVDETKNMILTYDGKPAVVFYHASCGGHTADVKDVFPGNDEPYLRGVEDGDPPNCSIAPNFKWTETYSSQKFIQRLQSSGYLPNGNFTLQNVSVANRNSSGRVENLSVDVKSVEGDTKNILITGNKIRSVIRTSNDKEILRSTMFDIVFNGSEVVINGVGNGHGVGLCQWGAIYQSTHGKNFKEILSFYFPGTQIGKIND